MPTCGMQHGMQYHRCQPIVIFVIRPVQNMWFVASSGSLPDLINVTLMFYRHTADHKYATDYSSGSSEGGDMTEIYTNFKIYVLTCTHTHSICEAVHEVRLENSS